MKAALLIIDVQIGLVELMPVELREKVLANIAALLVHARSSKTTVLYVQHDGAEGHPLEGDTPGWGIHPSVLPQRGEAIVRKRASDSFFETTLGGELDAAGITNLIVAGGMTEYCIDTTCRRAISLGYEVMLVSDGHLSRDSSVLSAAQIVAHHNLILDGFAAGSHAVHVMPTKEVLANAVFHP
jgi:nicotinamidase-related amidase